MKTKNMRLLFLVAIMLVSFLPAQMVLADTGPKPTMDFNFKGLQDGELQIVSGILYECDQPDCSDATPLKELGPQRLSCNTTGCSALAYGFADYHILEIEFSDEVTRKSNVFETAGFNSNYTVTVQPNDLLVKANIGLGVVSLYIWFYVIICLCLFAGTGLLVVVIVLVVRLVRKK